jgi:hypothetical protein
VKRLAHRGLLGAVSLRLHGVVLGVDLIEPLAERATHVLLDAGEAIDLLLGELTVRRRRKRRLIGNLLFQLTKLPEAIEIIARVLNDRAGCAIQVVPAHSE